MDSEHGEIWRSDSDVALAYGFRGSNKKVLIFGVYLCENMSLFIYKNFHRALSTMALKGFQV